MEANTKTTKIDLEPLSKEVVDIGYKIHQKMGSGLLECIYNKIIVELKSVKKIIPAHSAQILSYMRLSACKTGLIINFGEPYFKQAIKRFVL